jgi:uncharacterized protein (TIGR02611 family)
MWRVVVAIAGSAVIAAGFAMLVLPGPGLVAILLGLAILSTEFKWARRFLDRAARWVKKHRDRLRTSSSRK